MTQKQIADELGITFNGAMLGKLDCYTCQLTRSTLAVPIGADVETVRAKLLAMRAKFNAPK